MIIILLFLRVVYSLSILDYLKSDSSFSSFLYNLEVSNISLSDVPHNISVLAPKNQAFGIAPVFPPNVMQYHVMNTSVYSSKKGQVGYSLLDQGTPVLLKDSRVNGIVTITQENIQLDNGVIHVIDQVINIPSKTELILGESIFGKLYKAAKEDMSIENVELSTLLIPTDEAFNLTFNQVELDYLQSQQGKKDRIALIKSLSISKFLPSPFIEDTIETHTMDGSSLSISSDMTLNNSIAPIETNVFTLDAVLHFYNTYPNPHLISFTPEKYLFGLGAISFWEEVNFRKLTSQLQDPTVYQTVFVPLEDDTDALDYDVSINSKASILYHFVHDKISLDFDEVLDNNVLLTSMASRKKILGGAEQKIKVVASERNHQLYVNGRDAIVSSQPYSVGNTNIYMIDGSLQLPPELSLVIGSLFECSTSAGFFNQFDLLGFLSKKHGYTILLPTDTAWERLGLVADYLIRNETALRTVINSIVIKQPFYSDSANVLEAKLLDGRTVSLSAVSKSGRHFKTTQTSFALYLDDTSYTVHTPNILYSSGVIHPVSKLVLPPTIEITPDQLLDTLDTEIFVDLLNKRNLSHVLDPVNNFTILAPSDAILSAYNITQYSPNIDRLLKLHILPGNLIFSGEPVETLESSISLIMKQTSSDRYVISIFNDDGDHDIHVISYGQSTTGTTILYVDRFVDPGWLGQPRPRLRTLAAILLGVVFSAAFGSGAIILWIGKNVLVHSSKKSERQRLLSSSQENMYGAVYNYNGSARSIHSQHIPTLTEHYEEPPVRRKSEPIATPFVHQARKGKGLPRV